MADINYLDPMFPLPEGMDPRTWSHAPIEGEVDGDEDTLESDDLDDFVDVDSDVEIIDDGGDADGDIEAPIAPDLLTVVGQTIRRASDGSLVVDVVVDVEDVFGVNKYEFRVTKL